MTHCESEAAASTAAEELGRASVFVEAMQEGVRNQDADCSAAKKEQDLFFAKRLLMSDCTVCA